MGNYVELTQPLHIHQLFTIFQQFQFLPIVEEIKEFVALDLLETDLEFKTTVLLQHSQYFLTGEVLESSVAALFVLIISLILVSHHSPRLTATCLAIREECHLISLKK